MVNDGAPPNPFRARPCRGLRVVDFEPVESTATLILCYIIDIINILIIVCNNTEDIIDIY